MKKQNIKLSEIKMGETFKWAGIDLVALEPRGDGIYCITAKEVAGTMPFAKPEDGPDYNNFGTSFLFRWLNGEFKEKLLAAGAAESDMLFHNVDLLAMNGSREYGVVFAQVTLPTVDDYRQLRDLIPYIKEWTWTATPWATLRSPYSNADSADSVNTAGALGNYGVCSAGSYCPRPALCLSSEISVSVKRS